VISCEYVHVAHLLYRNEVFPLSNNYVLADLISSLSHLLDWVNSNTCLSYCFYIFKDQIVKCFNIYLEEKRAYLQL
jgi:hypothetical protein